MHIHILGICGTFMGGLAALAKEAGCRVTGCDTQVYPPMSTQLEALGIELIEGFEPEQIQESVDCYVVGNVIKRGNPLMEAILNRGLPYTSGPQWLAEQLLRDKWVLAVAGTHGKTTTSAMLAWILEYAGLAPGFLIGGVPQNFAVSARLPGTPVADLGSISPFFVIEADEYDTAFFDKRSKFIHYHPRTLILNNLEFDHADIFADLAAIETQFHQLIRTVPSEGLIVSYNEDKNLHRVIEKGCWTPVEAFGGKDSPWRLGESFRLNELAVWHHHALQGKVDWDLLGEHNRLNALAALLAARHVGVSPTLSLEALALFKNVKRRMERLAQINGITLYDDFAHHPTAIAKTLQGLRQQVGTERIIVLLEPRSNTMKQGILKADLPEALQQADKVLLFADPSLAWSAEETFGQSPQVSVLHDLDQLLQETINEAQPGDHVLIMSNGGFGGIHQRLQAQLARKATAL